MICYFKSKSLVFLKNLGVFSVFFRENIVRLILFLYYIFIEVILEVMKFKWFFFIKE